MFCETIQPSWTNFKPRLFAVYFVGVTARNVYDIWLPQSDSVVRVRYVVLEESHFFNPERRSNRRRAF
ncbi:hypothetical protein K470DRAFT_152433 [Piedraia hortae CBS 480.64]|uniref:Uncharacterized protein n=1 Tax=Piedraia hortae CBS 480.64 TaxID=1314780 RepID=A0A6A7BTM6_9PEZI|nr:hypothetical protein K470DRAFT_152433 [Piedraia hortae CBS 480.64]